MNNELISIAAKTAESVIDTNDSLDIIQLVSFKLDKISIPYSILSVHEILRIPEITRLPNAPDYIKGVINLRGNVIPVVDIRMRFGMPSAPVTELSRIIVVEIGEKLVGLMVDNVYQVIRLSRSRIDEPHELIEGISTEFINGIGRLQDRLIVILRLDNILFGEE
ncbi:MAG TPA: chemotaxis protein CheW [Spirochaetota bacterium]|nr:chemotaxis protein CheW [Spirochaetota bacterium]